MTEGGQNGTERDREMGISDFRTNNKKSQFLGKSGISRGKIHLNMCTRRAHMFISDFLAFRTISTKQYYHEVILKFF